MKYSNLRAFNKHLKEAAPLHLSSVYMLLGKNEFDRKEATKDLTRSLLSTQHSSEHTLKVFDGERLSINEVMQDLHSITFFAENRVVLINQAEKLTKPSTALLGQYFDNTNPSVFLIISASTINRATSFYKNAEKIGVVLDLVEEKPWEKENTLVQKIVERTREKGKTIDQNTSRYLAKYVGTDQAQLQQEIEKLICYVGGRDVIAEVDVSAICTGMNTENTWQLGEAIFRGEGGKALRIANALLSEREPFFSLVRQVRSQFQSKFQICAILFSGGSSADVQKQFPYMKGQILQKNTELARHYGIDRFRKGMLAIDETEVLAKNSGLSHDLLFERLILKLTT